MAISTAIFLAPVSVRCIDAQSRSAPPMWAQIGTTDTRNEAFNKLVQRARRDSTFRASLVRELRELHTDDVPYVALVLGFCKEIDLESTNALLSCMTHGNLFAKWGALIALGSNTPAPDESPTRDYSVCEALPLFLSFASEWRFNRGDSVPHPSRGFAAPWSFSAILGAEEPYATQLARFDRDALVSKVLDQLDLESQELTPLGVLRATEVVRIALNYFLVPEDPAAHRLALALCHAATKQASSARSLLCPALYFLSQRAVMPAHTRIDELSKLAREVADNDVTLIAYVRVVLQPYLSVRVPHALRSTAECAVLDLRRKLTTISLDLFDPSRFVTINETNAELLDALIARCEREVYELRVVRNRGRR